MPDFIERLVRDYTEALRGYLADPGEAALERAYDLGRETMTLQLHSLDIVSLHQRALVELVFSAPQQDNLAERTKLSSTFLAECLAPYEMTHRGYREAIAKLSLRTAELSRAMEKLETESQERTEVERALHRSEELFRSLIEHASEVIMVLSIDGTIKYESPSIERILGYRELDLVGLNAYDFIHPEDRVELDLTFRDSIVTPGSSDYRIFRFKHHSGEWRILEAVGRNLLDVESIGGILLASRDITEKVSLQRKLQDAAVRRADDARGFALRIQNVQEEERQRIARDLHDDICQRLSILRLNAGVLEDAISAKNASARQSVRAIKQQLDLVIDDIRRMSANLRPMSLDLFGLRSSLRMLCEGMRKALGIGIEFHACGDCDRRYEAPMEIAVYRIAQEALSNMSKHAGASKATVELRCDEKEVQLTLTDNGRGFTPGRSQESSLGLNGRGLVFMRERAELLGGEFVIESSPGDGATIRVTLPVKGEEVKEP